MSTVTLQASKNFLWIQPTHMKYPRGRPEPGECSAHRIMVIRLVERKRRSQNGENVKKFRLRAVLTCASLIIINLQTRTFDFVIGTNNSTVTHQRVRQF